MSTSDPILIIDVNVIIHLEKAGLLDELINDKSIRIVDLVLYDEYQFKKNLISEKVELIKQVTLNENQINEAGLLYNENRRNSFYDYCSYIAARDNNYSLLTGDWKLKRWVCKNVEVHGAIWYVQRLESAGIIDKKRLKEIYMIWLNDTQVFMPEELLASLIMEIE